MFHLGNILKKQIASLLNGMLTDEQKFTVNVFVCLDSTDMNNFSFHSYVFYYLYIISILFVQIKIK